jgi:hypothetical protein
MILGLSQAEAGAASVKAASAVASAMLAPRKKLFFKELESRLRRIGTRWDLFIIDPRYTITV